MEHEAHTRLLAAVRVGLLALCGGLVGATGHPDQPAIWLGGLACAAAVGSIPPPSSGWRRGLPLIETVVAAVIIGQPATGTESLLPYLLAPAFASGLVNGPLWPPINVAAAHLIVSAEALVLRHGDTRSYLVKLTTWVLLSLAVGLLGAWVRRLRQQPPAAADPSYVAAYRLLSQLHTVSRHLSAGLDPVALGQSLLEKVGVIVRFGRAAVLVRSPGGRLVPLATAGADQAGWESEPDEDSPLFEAWATAEPVQRSSEAGDCTDHQVVLPLRFGLRNFGLVAMQVSERVASADVQQAQDFTNESALPLATALLFTDIRSIATAEERRRLAREIHDGIAQELASLGYVVDDLAAEARDLPAFQRQLATLRSEITRLVSELRLSIFDLRSEVASSGLGTTLADYVRQVGAESRLTVHLILDESPARLRLETEAELLRIAQEAVTNVRKHANAENLWVTCRIVPPSALVRIEDDGRGLGSGGRRDSFGMEIMKERAARVGASFRVEPRDDGGTVVEVTLGPVPELWMTGREDVKEKL